jgi:hypothetical protein
MIKRLTILSFLALCSCQTEKVTTSDGWPLPPPPRAMPQPPADLKADRMAFMVGSKPDDTDNNGFPDAIRISVALFSNEHPSALQEDGSFVFLLYPQGDSSLPDARPIAQWRMDGDAVRTAMTGSQYGPCYLFTLSLLDPAARPDKDKGMAGDRLALDRADMVCRFEPADGSKPIVSMGVRTIQIGARMLSGAP